jgi:hypothetical protein
MVGCCHDEADFTRTPTYSFVWSVCDNSRHLPRAGIATVAAGTLAQRSALLHGHRPLYRTINCLPDHGNIGSDKKQVHRLSQLIEENTSWLSYRADSQ